MRVLDRSGLEKRACECYAVVKKEFAKRLLEASPAHDDERTTPIKQLGEQDQTHSSRGIDASGLDTSLFVGRELPAQKQVLYLKRASRLDRKCD